MSDDERDTLQPIGADGQLERIAERIAERQAMAPPEDPEREARRHQAREEALAAARLAVFAAEAPERFAAAELAHLVSATPPVSPEVLEATAAWASGEHRDNCVHVGPVGVGKTYAAFAQARYAVGTTARTWLALTTRQLLLLARPGGDPEVIDRACSVDLLLLDEVGAERRTDSGWAEEQLDHVIDTRQARRRPIIATSNLEVGPGGTLELALGARTYSRLVGDGATVVRWPHDAPDRRRWKP